jgi:F-type H+-transporting ATPase subunit b
MDEILGQLGGLLLASIPTIVVFLVVYLAYRQLVHKRLLAVLSERHERTEGAMETAKADIAAAAARATEYEERLREARVSIFKKLEARRQQLLEARRSAVAEARSAADARVKSARAALEQDVEHARKTLEAQSESLASQIINAVLRPAGNSVAAESPAAGGRQS